MKFLCAPLLLALTSCASHHTVQTPILTGTRTTGPWLNGRQLQVDTFGEIRAMIGYEAHTADALVFQLGITNNSDAPILVDPALFTSLSVEFAASVKDSAKYKKTKPGMDPEVLIAHQQDIANQQLAQLARSENTTATLLFLDALISVGNRSSTQSQHWQSETNTQRMVSEVKTKMDIAETKKQANDFRAMLLRKTTVFPGGSVAGLVYFYRHNKCTQLRLSLPIQSQTFSFTYNQTLITKKY